MNEKRAPPKARVAAPAGFHTRLTASLVVRQVGLLFVIGTLLMAILFLFNFYGVVTWENLSAQPLSLKYITLPAIVVFVYGYVFFIGILFALVPSEQSYRFFFYGILFALVLSNYDHSVLDWIAGAAIATVTQKNPVSVFKVALSAGLLCAVILMHYNILSDDFTRRMIRRGVPTQEVLKVRPGMIKALLPLLTAASVGAVALALVGEFSALAFGRVGLFPKFEMILLAILGVAIAFLLRSIIRELWQGGEDESEAGRPPNG